LNRPEPKSGVRETANDQAQPSPMAARSLDGKRAEETHGIEFFLRRGQQRFVAGLELLHVVARTVAANQLRTDFKSPVYLVLSSQ
jgi:hypothetical protein